MVYIDRSRRIANQVQQTLAKIIQQDLADNLNDKRLKFLTLTDVRVTKDMRQATIYVSTLNNHNKSENSELVSILNTEKGLIRKHLSQELNLRVTPDLLFRVDELIEQGEKIDALLKKISKE